MLSKILLFTLLLFSVISFGDQACTWLPTDKLDSEDLPLYFRGEWFLYGETPGFPSFSEAYQHDFTWMESEGPVEFLRDQASEQDGTAVSDKFIQVSCGQENVEAQCLFDQEYVQLYGHKLASEGVIVLYNCRIERRNPVIRTAVLVHKEHSMSVHRIDNLIKLLQWNSIIPAGEFQIVKDLNNGY